MPATPRILRRIMHPYLKLIAAVAALLALSACGETQTDSQARPAQPAVPVIVESLQFEPERTHVEAVGTSRAMRSVDVYPATSGEVIAVDFEPGQFVSEGDKLIELDRREQELAVELAGLQLAEARRLLDDDHRFIGTRSGDCRGDSGRRTADDNDVVIVCLLRVSSRSDCRCE